MGLDMYLTAERFLSGYDYHPEEKVLNKCISNLVMEPESQKFVNPEAFVTIEIQLAYWRKANQIHLWFVENVQNDVDDCRNYYVSEEQLQELHSRCVQALDTRDTDLLPTQGGFFFGSTDYDDHYWEVLKNTVRQLNNVFAFLKSEESNLWSLSYHSSW